MSANELKRLKHGSTRWMLRGGLGQIKERFGSKSLSPCDLLVLAGMADRAEGDGLCFIDQTKLADGLGISRGAVQKSQTKLRKLGVIVATKEVRRGRAAVYRIYVDAHRIDNSDDDSKCNLEGPGDAHRMDAKYVKTELPEAKGVIVPAAARGSNDEALRAANDEEKREGGVAVTRSRGRGDEDLEALLERSKAKVAAVTSSFSGGLTEAEIADARAGRLRGVPQTVRDRRAEQQIRS